ncbi:MAG: GNAT family N-acetyltransferase [Inhella sp.]|uniref:GNAT family N-acetyltransferase n=1 Tax=Inhella sp. TaxID=1921806 RepID=UPI0022BDDF85|nr:GNAT family N-acetyltransferase [Inhella sp.]MCZ8235825.1 GNAT family N-acetyltransferase [Inhella sp.]
MPDAACALVPTDQLAPEALHAAFMRAFADYVAGPAHIELAQWPGLLSRQGVDLALGRAALEPSTGSVLGFVLVAPRAVLSRWRIGTMGAVPEARGSGAARLLLQDLLQRARAAGMAAVELEVFDQNPRAVRLYQQHGFVAQHPLHGYSAAAPEASPPTPPPVAWACAPAAALAWLDGAAAAVPDLPLQVAAPVVQALTTPWTAWRCGTAQLVFSGDSATGLIVRSLIDRDPAQADAERLVRGLLAAHPGARVIVPPLQRPDLGGEALVRAGFERDPLWQWLMRCDRPSSVAVT